MSGASKKVEAPPIVVATTSPPIVHDESAKIKNSMTMRGWHPNYAEFDQDGVKGCLTFYGTSLVLEVYGQPREAGKRFRIDIADLVDELVFGNSTKADE